MYMSFAKTLFLHNVWDIEIEVLNFYVTKVHEVR